MLSALAARISAGIATGAAARGIELRSVSSTVSGEIDVRRVLGIDPDVRKGFSSVSAEFDVDAVAPPEAIEALVASATEYSPVFDMLVNPTSVEATRRAPCAGG